MIHGNRYPRIALWLILLAFAFFFSSIAHASPGKALQFSGDVGSVVHTGCPNPGSNPVTLAFWVNSDTDSPEGMFDSAAGYANVLRNLPQGVIEWWNSSPTIEVGITAGSWNLLVFTYYLDEQAHRWIKWWKNGVAQPSVMADSGDAYYAWEQLKLGCINYAWHPDGYYGTNPFLGKLDEIVVFTRELTTAEQTALWNNGNGAPTNISQEPWNNGLWAAYRLDEGSGSTIYDSSPNHYSGSISGSGITWVDGHVESSTPFTIEVIKSGSGSGDMNPESGIYSVFLGDGKQFYFYPNTGSTLNVLVDGVSIGAVDTYSLSNISSNHSIEVIFTDYSNYWIGGSSDGDWDDPANWSNAVTPSPESIVIFDTGSNPCVIRGSHTISELICYNGDQLISQEAGSSLTVSNRFMLFSGLYVANYNCPVSSTEFWANDFYSNTDSFYRADYDIEHNAVAIYDIYGLQGLSCAVWQLGTINVQLMNDISAEGTANWHNDGAIGFNPISFYFDNTGTFEGNGYTISGLNMLYSEEESSIGLFGSLNINSWPPLAKYTVQNLNFTGAKVSGGEDVGILAGGIGMLEASLINCHASGTVDGYDSVGGLVGSLGSYRIEGDAAGTISNCSFTGHVGASDSAAVNAGGLIGDVYNIQEISNCRATITATFENGSGGLCGNAGNIGNIFDCTVEAIINIRDTDLGIYCIGGLFGSLTLRETMEGCSAVATIEFTDIGGQDPNACSCLVGYFDSANGMAATVRNCQASGSMNIGISGFQLGGVFGTAGPVGLVALIENCHFNGSIVGNSQLGGLGGYMYDIAAIRNCSSSGSISSLGSEPGYVGGLIGFAIDCQLISHCSSDATVDGDITAGYANGGLIGSLLDYSVYTTVEACFASGTVTGNTCLGGLIGNASSVLIDQCYASGNVIMDSSGSYAGGLIGSSGDGELRTLNCYAIGRVGTEGATNIGGLVGATNTPSYIVNSYSISAVFGSSPVGGLIGWGDAGSPVSSFYGSAESGQNDDDGRGTPETTAWLKDKTNFETNGWDFTPVTGAWGVSNLRNHGYPYLLAIPPGPSSGFVITSGAMAHGSISPSGEVNVDSGSSSTFTISPDSSYRIWKVLVDGSNIGATSEYTFSNISANHSIEAWFAEESSREPFSITMNGTALLNGDIISAEGVLTVTATTLAFSGLSASEIKLSAIDPDTYRMYIDGNLVTDGDNIYYDTFSEYGGVASFEYTPKTPLSVGTHTIAVEFTDNSGVLYSATYTGLRVMAIVGVVGDPLCYPNPYDPALGNVRIAYNLALDTDIKAYIFDASGQLIWKNNYLSGGTGGKAGYNEITWNAKNQFGGNTQNGLYLIRLADSSGKVLGKGRLMILRSR